MANVPVYKISLERDCEGGSLFKRGTLVLTVSGPQAKMATYTTLKSMLAAHGKIGIDGVEAVYRLDSTPRFYASLFDAAHEKHYARMHGFKMESLSPRFEVFVEHLEKERSKGMIQWVPVGVKADTIKRVIRDFTQDEEADAHKLPGAFDKYSFQYKKKEEVELPYYVDLEVEEEKEGRKMKRMNVIIPGRRPPCNLCGSGEHWWSECPTRRPQWVQPAGRAGRGREWPALAKEGGSGVQKQQQQQKPQQHQQQFQSQPRRSQPDADGFTEVHGKKRKKGSMQDAEMGEGQQSQDFLTQDPQMVAVSWSSIVALSPAKERQSPVKGRQSPTKGYQSPTKGHQSPAKGSQSHVKGQEKKQESISRDFNHRPRIARTPRKDSRGSQQTVVASSWTSLASQTPQERFQPEEAMAAEEDKPETTAQHTVEVSDDEDLFLNKLVIDEIPDSM